MSYTSSLTERQNENLDVRIFDIASKFGARNIDTMQWTFDNHQIFLMARSLLDSEEKRMIGGNEKKLNADAKVYLPRALVDRLTKWIMCMSYNSSYFGEPSGELKRITDDMGWAVAHSDLAVHAELESLNPVAVVLPVFGSGTLDLQGAEGVTVSVKDVQSVPAKEIDAADPHGKYHGPNLTFDRLNVMRDFAADQSEDGVKTVKIQTETLLCLIDTIQHHEYVPRDLTPISTAVLDLADRLGSEKPYDVDQQAWKHLLSHVDRQSDWQTGTPPTKEHDYDPYIVAVRRAYEPSRIFVFAANYANNYDNELQDQDGDGFTANGWYDVGHDTSGEFDTLFMPTLTKGDEVVGWQPLPKWRGA